MPTPDAHHVVTGRPRYLLRLRKQLPEQITGPIPWPTTDELRAIVRKMQAAARLAKYGPRRRGRPISSTHPRAEYWREYKRKRKVKT